LPELEATRCQSVATPERRTRNITTGELRIELSHSSFVLMFGPFALRATRSAKNFEMKSQGA